MESKRVEFHEAAIVELEAALTWYFERSERAALRFASEVERAVALIAKTPERFPADAGGTRRFLLQRFPFAVIYRDLPSVIQILAVAHGRRRPGYWKPRV